MRGLVFSSAADGAAWYLRIMTTETHSLRRITILVGANGSGKSAWAFAQEPWIVDFESISARLRAGHKNMQSLIARFEFSHPVISIDKPETSLHPRLQGELADLFVAVAALNKQLIIETHSEPLISRLGELVSEGKLDRAWCSVMLFHRTEDGATQIRTTEFDEDGMLRDWPIGFLSA